MAEKRTEIRPQPGPQSDFISSPADIVIYGGAAGGGKSFALLLEPLRHVQNENFGAVIFRRTTKQVTNEGGLWDEAGKLYGPLMAEPKIGSLEWVFPSGMRVQFSHLEHESNIYDWQGAQIPLIGFDELTHFSEKQFWYMLSRNRSTSGVPGYVRATCNADADSWVRKLIDWWIDPKTGFPIPERAGFVRHFLRINDEFHWADSKEDLEKRFGDKSFPKSLTFIPAKLEDNPIFIEKDPGYQANLNALPLLDRQRLKDGNWNAKPVSGMFYRRHWFEVVQAVPAAVKSARYWDRAATDPSPSNPDPDYTVGLKLTRDKQGLFYIEDVVRFQGSPLKVESAILNTAKQDGSTTQIWLEQDPGQAGVVEAKYYSRILAGFDVRFNPVRKDKITRSRPSSSQAEAGNIKIKEAPWNEDLLKELAAFPEVSHDDQADALSGAVFAILGGATGQFTADMANSNVSTIVNQESDSEW
jgi:predicted phage terminase large subunit-like protein